MRVQCACGRFMKDAHAIVAIGMDCYLKEVRGNCSRCGPDVVAGEGWWWSWDAWDMDEWASEQVDELLKSVAS